MVLQKVIICLLASILGVLTFAAAEYKQAQAEHAKRFERKAPGIKSNWSHIKDYRLP